MPCLEIPKLPLPTLPDGITLPGIDVSLAVDTEIDLCCKLPIKIPIPPLNLLPVPINPGFIALLNAYIQGLQEYLHSIPLTCPLE